MVKLNISHFRLFVFLTQSYSFQLRALAAMPPSFVSSSRELLSSVRTFFIVAMTDDVDTSDGQPILWDEQIADPGNNFDALTGTYEAPVDGFYEYEL